jgi:hypothetical protein
LEKIHGILNTAIVKSGFPVSDELSFTTGEASWETLRMVPQRQQLRVQLPS